MRNSLFCYTIVLVTLLQTANADDWPQWRGPRRDNKSQETGLLKTWPEKGPPLDWRVDGLGDGIASLAIANGRIFTSTSYGNAEYAVALDVHTGQSIWTTEIGTAVQENLLMRWLSQRTPTVDGAQLYVFTKSGWLVCMDTMSGQIHWRISYPHEFGTKQGKWGFCDRPLVDGDKLICSPGGTNATLVALDKHSGKRLWSTLLETKEATGYASTIQVETDGLKQYVAFLDTGVVSFAADDGRILWRYDRIANRTANSYTPLVLEDGLLCANGYGSGIARLKLIRSENKVIFKELFVQSSSFDPFEDSPLLVDGHLFAFLQGGIPACLEIGKGEMLWKKRGSGKGKAAATYADGNIIVRWSDGTVALVHSSPADYVEKSIFRLDEPRDGIGSTFPVVAGGRLYLRDNDRLYKYDITQRSRDAVPPEPRVITLATPRESKRAPLPAGQRAANAIFVPTPMDVVAKVLEVAQLGQNDLLFDLGSGDGRIVIEAAKQYGCRAVGIELDSDLVTLSKQRVLDAKLESFATVTEADFFETDFSQATVVTAYLPSDLLQRLLPKLQKLKPGSRIVTHQFAIPGLTPVKTVKLTSTETGAEHTIYLWTMPFPNNQ